MRLDDTATFADEVVGTTVGDRLEVNVWRGGILLAQDLDVMAWSLNWDAGRQVQGQASLTVADDSGDLAPWSMADPLAPGGSRLQISWVSGLTGLAVPLGWWRIRKAEPLERWRFYTVPQRQTLIPRSAPQRVNRLTNPRPVGATLWSFNNAGGTAGSPVTVTSADGPQARAGYRRTTLTTGGADGNVGHFVRAPDGSMPGGRAGDRVPVSIWVRYSKATSVRISANGRAGGAASASTFGSYVSVPANVWTQLTLTLIAAANYDAIQVSAFSNLTATWAVGNTLDAGSAMIGRADDPAGSYFDGSIPSTSAYGYAWTGAADASTSTEAPMVLSRLAYATQPVSGGGSVRVEADEETSTIVLDRLDAEVVQRSSCLNEVARLLEDIMPVSPIGGLVDGPVPSGFVYGNSRIDAVEDLLAPLYAVYRLGPDGVLELLPATGIGPVWTVVGGEDGVLVSLVRALSDEGVYNAAISSGETSTGQPLVGRAYIGAGTLEWGGAYGRVPIFHDAIAQTAAGVQADALTVLANLSSAGEVDLDVICLAHPGIQLHDLVTLVATTTAGGMPMVGRVVGMSLASAGSGSDGITPAKTMRLTVRVSAQTLEIVAGRVRAS